MSLLMTMVGMWQGEGITPPPSALVAITNQSIFDNHRYNKFPQPCSFTNGELITSFASSTTHTENGWLEVGKSTDGGDSWSFGRPYINSVQPTTVCTNMQVFEDNSVYMFYQDDENYNQCKLAKSTDRGNTWSYLGQHIFSEATYPTLPTSDPHAILCQFGTGKPVKLPSGKLLQPYYAFPVTSTDTCTIGLLQVVGDVVSQGPIIATSTGTTFPNGRKHETYLIITEMGASDATTKLVAMSRNNDYGFWAHYKSANGGATWTMDTTAHIGYQFGTSLVPISAAIHSGTAYLFIGTRDFVGGDLICKIGYITCTPDDLYNNNQPAMSDVTWIYEDTLAEAYGADIDFGYVDVDIQKSFNKMYLQWYGASQDSASNSTGFKWLRIGQLALPINNNKKNIQIASFSMDGFYWMAGELTPKRTGPNRWTYFLRRADDHLNGGKVYGVHYYEDTNTWGVPFLVYDPPVKQTDDVSVGIINGDLILLSFGATDHGVTSWDLHPVYQKLDFSMSLVGGQYPVTGTTGVPQRQYEWIFGQIIADPDGDPDTFYSSLVQIDIDSGTPGEKVLSMLKSTDNGATWTRHPIQTTTAGISETVVLPLGGGNLMALCRIDGGGYWQTWKSTNDGVSWTFIDYSNLGFGTSFEKVTKAYRNLDGTWDFIVQDRDSGFIIVSRNNDPIADGSFVTADFKLPELYYYNWTGDSHRGLGYASQIDLGGGVKMVVWAREAPTNDYTNIMFTRDDDVDVAMPPVIPNIDAPSIYIGATSALVQINGYTSGQIQAWNTRWYTFDVSTDPAFGSFATGRYLPELGDVTLHDRRLLSWNISLDHLTTATTYYVRIKAHNQLGSTSYTTQSFTTL